MKKLAVVLAFICLLPCLFACTKQGEASSISGAELENKGIIPAAAEYIKGEGHFVEYNITPESVKGVFHNVFIAENGFIGLVYQAPQQMRQYSLLGESYSYYESSTDFYYYESNDYGASWQEKDISWVQNYIKIPPAGDFTSTRKSIYNLYPLEGGAFLAQCEDTSRTNSSFYLYVNAQGEEKYIEPEKNLKGQANRVFFGFMGYLSGNAALFSVNEYDEEGAGSYRQNAIINISNGELIYNYEYAGTSNVFAADGNFYYYDNAEESFVAINLESGEKTTCDDMADIESFMQASAGHYSSYGLYNTGNAVFADMQGSGSYFHAGNYGVSKIEPGEKQAGIIFSSMGYSFASPRQTIKAAAAVSQGDIILALADDDGILKLLRYIYNQAEKPEKEKQLRIYSLYDSRTIRLAAAEYEILHPDTEITFEYSFDFQHDYLREIEMPAPSAIEIDDILKPLINETLAGKGPDIFILDGLPYTSFAEKGILEDLAAHSGGWGLIEEIGESLKSANGALYYVPATFSMPVLILPQQEAADYSSLDILVNGILNAPDMQAAIAPPLSDNWLEYVEQSNDFMYNGQYAALDKNEMPLLFVEGLNELAEDFCRFNAPALYSAQSGLNEEKLAELYENIKQIADYYGLANEDIIKRNIVSKGYREINSAFLPVPASLIMLERHRSTLAYCELNSFYLLQGSAHELDMTYLKNPQFDEADFFTEVQAMPCLAEGTYFPRILTGVNAASKNKQSALEFIDVLFAQQVQGYELGEGLPAAKNAFESSLSRALPLNVPYSAANKQNGRVYINTEDILKGLSAPYSANIMVEEYIVENAIAYSSGELTLEQALQNVAAQTELYFAEKQ